MSVEQLAINTIRTLTIDGVQKATCGHPGMPMGCAPIAFELYAKLMKHNPKNPKWLNRDRFVLSAGHGSMLLYSILHLSGYGITLEDIKNFRQWGSITPGHPEFGHTPGVETTTGPLGQGFANAVGMAIAQEYLAAYFNKEDAKILDHYIYGICSDGDLMEGVSHEAASIAGNLGLGKIVLFYDNNGITIEGSTKITFTEDIKKRFEAYGWHVEHISDVNDLNQIETALAAGKKDPRPTLIITDTHIGFGSPNKQDTGEIHGSALGEAEILLTKKNLGWPYEEKFTVPQEVKDLFAGLAPVYADYEAEWNAQFASYQAKYPVEAQLFLDVMDGKFGTEWVSKLPVFPDEGKKIATRQASGKVLNAIAASIPTLIGGSADLAPSTNTYLNGLGDFSKGKFAGRNFHFGIREHGMASIMNGMAMYGGVIPYGATFFVFSDYLRPAIRIAALSKVKPIYVLTHDSIGLGEDGPTHQPVEHLAALRSIPGLIVVRPADPNETSYAWKVAIEAKGQPVALVLSRQGVPVLDQSKFASAAGLEKGAYILKEASSAPKAILLASGSEVQFVLKAQEQLEAEGIPTRVVSFPSWELFELQSDEYRAAVLPPAVKVRVAVEAGVKLGWREYVGDQGKVVSIEKYGASAPDNILFREYGFTSENIIAQVKAQLA
jgi:transketolase